MTWLLYSGGAVKNNVQAKELALGSVEAEATRTYQSVRNGVYSAWHELQRSRARLKVAEEALKLAETHLHEVRLLYENGLVAKNQVLRVQVEVSNSKLNQVKAVNAVDVAWSALERAVGTDLQMDYTLPETRNSVDEFTIPSELRQLAMENRPELLALEKSRKSALAMARSAAGASRPQVALKAETFEVDDEFFPDKEDDWRVSISANWELFDGGASRARVEEAKAAAEEVLYRIEDLKKQINLEVSTAVLNLRSATQRVNLAKDQVKSAEEDYRIALKRYSAQVGTNIDVLDSRVALVNAKTQLANAVYDVYQARADLQYALGMDLYGGKNEGDTL
jgi:outer membrane protein TolC